MQSLPIPELAFCALRRKCRFPGGSSAGPAERGIKWEPAPKLTNSNGFHSRLIQLLTFSCHPAPFMCPKHPLGRAMWGCCCCWDVLPGFCSSWPLRAGPVRCRISWQGCKGSAAPSTVWLYFPGCSWHPCWTQLWKIFFPSFKYVVTFTRSFDL